ncbi:sensor histidine kinase [Bacillus methanolicus]|nr:histidine kinase [Bacillus methanolicus]
MSFWIFVAIAFFYLFEAGRDLMPANFRALLFSIFSLIGGIFFFHFSFYYWCIYIAISIAISMALFYFNSLQYELIYQRNLYDQLLDEYRKLKRLALENERTARLEERTRIAREMHDSVGHKLTALNLQIGMMLAENKTNLLLQMKEMVEDSLKETRRAVRALETDEIEGISSVIHLIRKLEAESHLRVHFTTKQGVLGVSLSNEHSVVMYRVIQEALTNAMKHAYSKEVYVTLGVSPIGQLTFEIKNKIHSHKPFHEGFGLRNIKERMMEIGGKITIFKTDNHFIIQGIMPGEGEKHDSNFAG